jgi:hypothetical protein
VNEENNKVKELEALKLALIEKYMKMQDEADEINERIYHICIDIEALNLKITQAKEDEEKKKAMAAKAARNPPPNGKPHDAAGQPAGRRNEDQTGR